MLVQFEIRLGEVKSPLTLHMLAQRLHRSLLNLSTHITYVKASADVTDTGDEILVTVGFKDVLRQDIPARADWFLSFAARDINLDLDHELGLTTPEHRAAVTGRRFQIEDITEERILDSAEDGQIVIVYGAGRVLIGPAVGAPGTERTIGDHLFVDLFAAGWRIEIPNTNILD